MCNFGRRVELLTNLGLIILQAKSFYTLGLLICFTLAPVFAQNPTAAKATPTTPTTSEVLQDSLPQNEPLLLDKVRYKAKDSIIIDKKNNKLYLYNEAEMEYQDMLIQSGLIVLDYKNNEVYAGRIAIDTAGTLAQYPYFKQAGNEVNPDSIRFNFTTQKALIWNSKSSEAGMNVFAGYTKKENDSVFYLQNAKVTTAGELEDADYYFKTRRAKLVPGGKIVTGFTNMFIADVPTPVALPFAYFPSNQSQASGFIFPTIGENNNRGYAVQNGGYYFDLSEYFNLSLMGDYYTNGSYGFRVDSQYRKRYKYSGNLSFRYENLIAGARGLPGYSKSTVYNIRWSHAKDTKASPYSNFSASVNYGSSDYYQQSVNNLNSPNFLNNNLSSSISYNKTFPGSPRVNTSITTSLSQNSNTKQVNLTLPTFQANMERIFPFAPKNGTKKGFIQNINFQYTTRAEQRIITQEDQLFQKGMFKNARSGMIHNIPLTTNFKLFKYLSVSMGGNYKEVWTPKTVRYQNYDATLGAAVLDTINKFDAFRTYNMSASMGTTVYGVVNFEKGKIRSVRHTIRPSISYSVNPSFEQYYDEYIIDAEGNTREYTRFQTSLFGTPGKSFSSSMGISVANNFEAKVVDKDTTNTELKKINLLKNLNFSTAYNFAQDSLRWSPVRMTTGIDALQGKMNINVGATFDPYGLDVNNQRYNNFDFRMTSANVNMSYSINSSDFEGGEGVEDNFETASSGGRSDDLFGQAPSITNRNTGDEEESPVKTYPLFRTKIPWNLKIAHSLTYSNSRGQNDFSNNSLMFSGNIELTPKWKVGLSSGYDFKGKGFTYTQLRFDRNLDSWKMNFSWVPFSDRSSWNFFIGIKSGMLSDIKYEKNREPDRSL
jgi:lipopolysaccharide assembly outer membrane protein LptD (OstA)